MKGDPRYEVVNPEIEAKMKDLGRRIHGALQEHPESKLCFALMIFEVDAKDGKGASFYIADVQRKDGLDALKTAIEKMEAQLKDGHN